MKFKIYENTLPSDAVKIRENVFVKEQGFENEFDETDKTASHIVLYDEEAGDELPVATCRVFESGDDENTYILGRLAVIRSYRGKNIGADMIREAQRYMLSKGGKIIALHAQCRVSGFYKKLGFCEYGGIEDDEGCPHIWMRKIIE